MNIFSQSFLGINVLHWIQMIASASLAVVFIQSGLDKLFNYKDNLSWLQSHFSKTFLRSSIPIVLPIIMIFELAAGGIALAGIFEILLALQSGLSFIGALIASINLIMLLLGQRLAKDYVGAAGIVPYLILTMLSLAILAI